MAKGSYSWSELYLIHDLYAAWIRVLIRWLYAEGFYCAPTVTISTRSEAAAQALAKAWEAALDEGLWSIQAVEHDAIAMSREAFEAEEAQNYTAAIETFSKAVSLPATLCSLYAIDPNEMPDRERRKISKIVGSSSDGEEEDEEALGTPMMLAMLRRWKDIPASFAGSKFAVSGKIVRGGMEGVRCVSFDGHRELEVTDVLERALRDTQAFMKEHGIGEPTPWFSNDEIAWKAPNRQVASRIAGCIVKWQGSARAEGDAVKGRPGEIWSALTWFKFARWGGVFHELGDARNDPRIPELLGEKAPQGGSFAGEVVCFTGKLDAMERDEARGLVEAQGGRTASTVTSEVTLVVATRAASSKRAKAEKLGLPIIDEAEFLSRAKR